MNQQENQLKPWQSRLHEIIYEADTPAGKLFDVVLITLIILSVINVMLESVQPIFSEYGRIIITLEWIFTILFTVEYFLRLICVKKPLSYALSFFGIIDLLAILPSYLELFINSENIHYLVIIRFMRVLRLFRILKLTPYLKEANILIIALQSSRRKILIFFSSVMVLVTIFGAIMFLLENKENPSFSSIPKGVYWAIVTITTVGFGDIAPKTPAGQFVCSIIMLLGYAIIAVPTGIVSVELNEAYKKQKDEKINTQSCPGCSKDGHDNNAKFCKFCGEKLNL